MVCPGADILRGMTTVRRILTAPLLGLGLVAGLAAGSALSGCGSDDRGGAVGVRVEDGDVVLTGEGSADAPVAEIFEDFACIHCAHLAEADRDSLDDALGGGELIVRYNLVNFMDPGPEGISTRAGAAALAIADSGDSRAFRDFHARVFADRGEALGWDAAQMADAAGEVGADDATVDAIRSGEAVAVYRSMLDANFTELKDRLPGGAGTPTVFVDGRQVDMQRDPVDPEKMADWVPGVLGRDN